MDLFNDHLEEEVKEMEIKYGDSELDLENKFKAKRSYT